MNVWLMDAYRSKDKIVLWIKTAEKDIRVERDFSARIYLEAVPLAQRLLKKYNIRHNILHRQTYLRQQKEVFEVAVPRLDGFERFIRDIERETKHRLPMYDCDITPEQMYLYVNKLVPCGPIHMEDDVIIPVDDDGAIPLTTMDLGVAIKDDVVTSMVVNDMMLEGEERDILQRFVTIFIRDDPDVLRMERAFALLPIVAQRLVRHHLHCPLHRWDPVPLNYRGGKSFFTYGTVRYQDFAIRLNGRFLLDTTTAVGGFCEPDAIVELCQLSGCRFQQVGSRSFGAVFQQALLRCMVEQGFLVPYKEKPIDRPVSWFDLLKTDRAGHTLDPKTGFHTDVAEIDFTSMYPWLIYNHNISADTILCDQGPFEHVPDVPIRISLRHKGLVPLAIKPFLDRRMKHKKNPSALNKTRAMGLKGVLVSSYGYLRFREFKLGVGSSHMAVGAFARETLIAASRLAEERGFEVVHGIVDSLYIKKKGMTHDDVKAFCSELEAITGIPLSFEGIFRWIVFLNSVVDVHRPLPARYFGVFESGDIKARGIEIRQRGTPKMVKLFQQHVLQEMATCSSKKEIAQKMPALCALLRTTLRLVPSMDADMLACACRVSTTDYKHDIPQRKAVRALQRKGVVVLPGHNIRYVFQEGKVVLPDDYDGRPDMARYRALLVRALFIVLQPFGATKEGILALSDSMRQTRIPEYARSSVKHVYVPIPRLYASNHGLAERQLRKRLEQQGWTVWRGGMIGAEQREDAYPNVRHKYERLTKLLENRGMLDELRYLCAVHHGMPDFLCYRNGEFKFVECKFKHEQLLESQRRCIPKLQQLGFEVEVHKFVSEETKSRIAIIDLQTNHKTVLKRQATLAQYKPINAQT